MPSVNQPSPGRGESAWEEVGWRGTRVFVAVKERLGLCRSVSQTEWEPTLPDTERGLGLVLAEDEPSEDSKEC